MVAQVFPVVRGVPPVGPSPVVLAPLGGLAALTSAPVEQDLDVPMAEESDTGPEEELWFVTGDDQEKSDIAVSVMIRPRRRGRAPGAEDLEHVLPADPAIVE